MKKKYVTSALLACMIFLISVVPAFAATSATVHLPDNVSVVFSDNITVGSNQKIAYTVANYWYSDYRIIWTLYKSGEGSKLTGLVDVNDIQSGYIDISSWGAGEYYLRLDCYHTTEYRTGCEGQGTITAVNS